jgi:hypothetical protein
MSLQPIFFSEIRVEEILVYSANRLQVMNEKGYIYSNETVKPTGYKYFTIPHTILLHTYSYIRLTGAALYARARTHNALPPHNQPSTTYVYIERARRLVEIVGEEGGEEGEGCGGQGGRAAARGRSSSSCCAGGSTGAWGLGFGGEHGGGRGGGGDDDEHGEGDLLHLHFFGSGRARGSWQGARVISCRRAGLFSRSRAARVYSDRLISLGCFCCV